VSGASIALKIGTVEFAIAAMPESMCRSPQAMSVNGTAPFRTPIARPCHPAPRRSAFARCQPDAATTKTKRAIAATARRISIIAGGEKSRPATLMKR
jgi:hypothetical protein